MVAAQLDGRMMTSMILSDAGALVVQGNVSVQVAE
jgi:hypothetical protein